ncbi:MAG TPA: hypothetical protein VG672_20865 [Bryobacteraceae bacterium]|nr:hypothetical protein [Bryobacteraceae bacterium]
MVPAVTVKVAELAPAATVTEAGVVSRLLLSDSVTVEPPDGAAALSLTVQVLEAREARLVGLQLRLESTTLEVCSVIVAVRELLPSVAVTVADWALLMVPAVTVKVAELAPAATVTEAGVVSRLLLSDRVTAEPPEGAAALSVTVQVLEAREARLVGLQLRLESTREGCIPSEAEIDLPLRVAVIATD